MIDSGSKNKNVWARRKVNAYFILVFRCVKDGIKNAKHASLTVKYNVFPKISLLTNFPDNRKTLTGMVQTETYDAVRSGAVT